MNGAYRSRALETGLHALRMPLGDAVTFPDIQVHVVQFQIFLLVPEIDEHASIIGLVDVFPPLHANGGDLLVVEEQDLLVRRRCIARQDR